MLMLTNGLTAQTASAAAKDKESDRQTGTIRLRLKDLSAAEIAAALSTPSRPFHKIKLAGLVSGNVEARWKDSTRNAEAQFVADVVPPAKPSRAQFPITAHAQGIYRAGPGELELAQLNASTRATQVHASGTLSSSAALKLSVTTTDLGEWQPVFSAAGYGGQIPVTLKGHASFNGTATGKALRDRDRGQFAVARLRNTDSRHLAHPRENGQMERPAADVQLSPSVFAVRNGTLSRDPDSLKFDFHAHLFQRQFTDTSAFQAHLDTENADLAGILALAGIRYPVTGTVDLHLQVAGTRAAPVGQGHDSAAQRHHLRRTG